VPGVDGVLVVAPHEVGELLDRGDDDARIRVVDLPAQLVGGLVGGDRPLGEAVVLLDGLVVQVLAVDDEDDLVDEPGFCQAACGFEAGEGLAAAGDAVQQKRLKFTKGRLNFIGSLLLVSI